MGVGWYRFAKFKPFNFDRAKGSTGNSVMIALKTYYITDGNLSDFILFNSAHEFSSFTVLGSQHRGNNISKIRHTVDMSTGTAYLEFYYECKSTIYSNPVFFELYSTTNAEQKYNWELMDFELTQETVENVVVYSSADLVNKERNVVTNSDLKSLHTPIYGNVLTNTIPSKTFTIINSMNLSKGVYIIYGFAQYTTEFSETCNYAMYQNDSLLVICRGTGTGGGGQTPFCILSLDNTATIKFGLYQPSSITREINYNRLIAVKLA